MLKTRKRYMGAGRALAGLVIMLTLGLAVHAAIPYLPLVGPPALRVGTTKYTAASSAKYILSCGKPLATETNLFLAGKGMSTNAALTTKLVRATESMPTASTNAMVPVETTAGQSIGTTLTGGVFVMPTPEMVGLTPQMLAAYFRPVQFGTNTTVVGPYPISFVPPLPPDKSSHAEYILK